jgi:hypothetical protein
MGTLRAYATRSLEGGEESNLPRFIANSSRSSRRTAAPGDGSNSAGYMENGIGVLCASIQ